MAYEPDSQGATDRFRSASESAWTSIPVAQIRLPLPRRWSDAGREEPLEEQAHLRPPPLRRRHRSQLGRAAVRVVAHPVSVSWGSRWQHAHQHSACAVAPKPVPKLQLHSSRRRQVVSIGAGALLGAPRWQKQHTNERLCRSITHTERLAGPVDCEHRVLLLAPRRCRSRTQQLAHELRAASEPRPAEPVELSGSGPSTCNA